MPVDDDELTSDFEHRIFRLTPSERFEQARGLFESWEEENQSGNSSRRYDLECYAFACLAIGRHPNRPPKWALEACQQLYERDSQAHSSPFARRSDRLMGRMLDDLAMVLIREEGYRVEDRPFEKLRKTSVNAAAKAVVEHHTGQRNVSEDDATKQRLSRLWRGQTDQEAKGRMHRALRRILMEQGADTFWYKPNSRD